MGNQECPHHDWENCLWCQRAENGRLNRHITKLDALIERMQKDLHFNRLDLEEKQKYVLHLERSIMAMKREKGEQMSRASGKRDKKEGLYEGDNALVVAYQRGYGDAEQKLKERVCPACREMLEKMEK